MSGHELSFSAATPMFVCDEDLQVVCWNEGAERLTGVPAAEALGRPCWEVIAGHDDAGNLVCHRGCSRARIVREGRCVPATALHARTATGRRRLALETIAARNGGGAFFLQLLRDAPAPAPEADGRAAPPRRRPSLTPRQTEVLAMLGEGRPVKTIAHELGLRQTTVRNHVRALLHELGAHSQLEAVARARAYEIL